jgi:hypothetical protein
MTVPSLVKIREVQIAGMDLVQLVKIVQNSRIVILDMFLTVLMMIVAQKVGLVMAYVMVKIRHGAVTSHVMLMMEAIVAQHAQMEK